MIRTLVLIKPQAVKRQLTGKIIARYEAKGLQIVSAKLLKADETLLAEHYGEHRYKPFYHNLLEKMQQGPIFAMVFEGPHAVTAARILNGATDPLKAQPGTIRGDYGLEMEHNIVHASDSTESAAREIALWFPELGV